MKQVLISFVIPCLNEKNTIKRLLEDIVINSRKLKLDSYETIVADNGSTDGTLEIIRRFKNVKIVNVRIKGYGAALHTGIKNARGKYIIFADADLSYPFSNLNKFILRIPEDPDLVLGSRFTGNISKGAMPPIHRYLGTPALTLLIRFLYKIPTTDCNSGMRMVKKSFYKKLNMRNSGMEWASELLLKTALKGGKYLEVPINYRKDKRGRSPHLSTWTEGWRHLKAILLLKPSSMYPILSIFIVLAFFFYPRSIGMSFLLLDLAVVLILSLLTLDLLGAIIEKRTTFVSNMLNKFTLVPATVGFGVLVSLAILIIPDGYLDVKLFLASILGIVFMWIFLVETIKTHLSNRLPD